MGSRARLTAAIACALALGSAASADAANIGPDYVASDNVELLGSIKFDVGQTAGLGERGALGCDEQDLQRCWHEGLGRSSQLA